MPSLRRARARLSATGRAGVRYSSGVPEMVETCAKCVITECKRVVTDPHAVLPTPLESASNLWR